MVSRGKEYCADRRKQYAFRYTDLPGVLRALRSGANRELLGHPVIRRGDRQGRFANLRT